MSEEPMPQLVQVVARAVVPTALLTGVTLLALHGWMATEVETFLQSRAQAIPDAAGAAIAVGSMNGAASVPVAEVLEAAQTRLYIWSALVVSLGAVVTAHLLSDRFTGARARAGSPALAVAG